MAKFLIQTTYTAEGLRGLQKDKASGRREAISKLMEALGGKLEALYYSLGDEDIVIIVDVPNIETVAAASITASATGLLRNRTTALMTVEEVDRALSMSVAFRPPGG